MAPNRADHITAEELVESSLPALSIGQYHTISPALHPLIYTGILQPWPNFEQNVQAAHQRPWRKRTLGLVLKSRDPYTSGNVEVVDEHGVLGRFHKYVGDVLNTVFETEAIDVKFADLKCIPSSFEGIPDVIMKTSTHQCKVVGEFKVHWIDAHGILAAYMNDDNLRKLLAQPIKYMKKLNCAYGFLSNYEETIFLRQLVDGNGIWRIEYSPVVLSNTQYSETNPLAVSVRQCFFHVGLEAQRTGPVNNTTPGWVVRG